MEREIKSPILFHAFKSLHYFVIKYKRTAEPPAVAEDRTTRYSCIPNTQKDRKITGHDTQIDGAPTGWLPDDDEKGA